MKHFADIDGVIHCDGSDGSGMLCGLGGVRGDSPMTESFARITCELCINIIKFCQRVPPAEVQVVHQCCETFAKAKTSGTDNEGYEALVYNDGDYRINIGSDLPPIHYCPWCGASTE